MGAAGRITGHANHYRLVRTIEDLYHLPALGQSDDATPIDEAAGAPKSDPFACSTDNRGQVIHLGGLLDSPFSATTAHKVVLQVLPLHDALYREGRLDGGYKAAISVHRPR